MIARCSADHLGREPYPDGAACGGDDPRRKPARSRAPANCVKEGSDGGALATPGRGRWELRRRSAAAVRFEVENKKPATDFSVRALQFSR